MTTITIHSFKGGTGKSIISVLMAYYLSKSGRKTLLIDSDYYAPCLSTYFPCSKAVEPFTSFLTEKSTIEDVIVETDFKNLDISYAPAPDFSEEILRADVHTHGQFLKRILMAREILTNEMGYSYILFDNSNGVSIPAINHLSCSNKSVIVIRPVRYGIEAVYDRLSAIYQKLQHVDSEIPRKDLFVWNQVPVNQNNEINPRIRMYLDHWKEKFREVWVDYGTTIPYNQQVVSSMIGDQQLDIQTLAEELEIYITELLTSLGESCE